MLDSPDAQGRLKDREPVAIIDIGSNSVRLVIFEGMVRAPSILFNEKVSAGLGRGIEKTGRMNDDGVCSALKALRRYSAVCDQVGVSEKFVLATAAAREAENGPSFIAEAEGALGTEITILTGEEEALYAATGIKSAFFQPDGFVGDLGGGSLELTNIAEQQIEERITLPLGVIRLEERSEASLKTARKLATTDLQASKLGKHASGRPFYCVGGTWRNLAKLHMHAAKYPLRVTHGYEVDALELLTFLDELLSNKIDNLPGIDEVSKSRRALLPYGATVLKALIEEFAPSKIIFSAYGVREGFLFSKLHPAVQVSDALLEASDELAILRSRSPQHARELAEWTSASFKAFGIDETIQESRYRLAACRLADIGWRAHPDYRAAQALAIIAYGHFVQISHQGRAFISLANYFRYQGIKNDNLAPELIEVATPRILSRARYLAAFMRVGYLLTAAMPGVLPELKWSASDDETLRLHLPSELAKMRGERLNGRLNQLSKVMDRTVEMVVDDDRRSNGLNGQSAITEPDGELASDQL
ncbi:MAG: Ppx/GppA phosphatase family protein [Pseudomonadota bacterium]